jgi:hypothetical protein
LRAQRRFEPQNDARFVDERSPTNIRAHIRPADAATGAASIGVIFVECSWAADFAQTDAYVTKLVKHFK